MVLGELIGTINAPMRIMIQSTDGTEFFRGYKGNYKNKTHDDAIVTAVELFTVLKRRQELLHVLPQIEEAETFGSTEGYEPVPDNITDINFKDMRMMFYQKITIKA